MKRALHLTKKNIKLLVRSKSSALILLLGPLFVIFLAGLAFDNTNAYQLNIGTYSPSYSSLANSYISQLSEQGFKVTRLSTETECIDSVKAGDTHSCLVFPQGFSYSDSNQITFYIDYSKINLAGTVLGTISSNLEERSSELSAELTGRLIEAFKEIEKETKAKKAVIVSLTSENDVMLKSVDQTTQSVKLLDLNVNEQAYGLPALEQARANLASIIQSLSNGSVQVLDSVLEDLSQAHSAVSQLEIEGSAGNTSEDQEEILDNLEATINTLLDVQENLNATHKLGALETEHLKELFAKARTQLNATQEKAAQVHKVREGSLANLKIVKDTLDSSLLKILELQKGLSTIEQTVTGIEITDPGTISTPIKTKIQPVTSEATTLNFIFPSLIALILMFTAILLAPTLVIMERKDAAYFRNFISPLKDAHYLAATILTCSLVLGLQVLIIFGIALLAFSSGLSINILSTLVLLAVFTLCFVLTGAIIGYVVTTQAMAILTALIVGSISLFLSDVIVPLESMPASILAITQYNPFLIGSSLLRKTLIFKAGLADILNPLLTLTGYTIALLLIAYGLQRLTKRGSLASVITHLFKRK